MRINNIKIYNNTHYETLIDLIIDKSCPNYNINMNNTSIFYFELYSIINNEVFMTVLSISKYTDYIGLSIVSGGSVQIYETIFDDNKKSNIKKLTKLIIEFLESKQIKYELLDNNLMI